MSVDDLKVISNAFGAAKKVIDDAIVSQTPATTPPVTSTPATPATPATPGLILPAKYTVPAEKLKLVMDEQFKSTTLDPKFWWTPYNGGPGSGTGGIGQRDGSLFSVNADGAVLGVVRPNPGDQDPNHWRSAGIAAGAAAQIYGVWETRFKMDKMPGSGPAIMLWMSNDRWPVEIEVDISEISGDRSQSQTTLHYGTDNKQVTIPTGALKADFTQWNTFVVEWTATRLSFWCNGKLYWDTTNKLYIPQTKHHFVAQTDMGSWLGTPSQSDPVRANLYVDYVRQWSIAA